MTLKKLKVEVAKVAVNFPFFLFLELVNLKARKIPIMHHSPSFTPGARGIGWGGRYAVGYCLTSRIHHCN